MLALGLGVDGFEHDGSIPLVGVEGGLGEELGAGGEVGAPDAAVHAFLRGGYRCRPRPVMAALAGLVSSVLGSINPYM